MNPEQNVILSALFGGAMGGFFAGLLVAYKNFKELPPEGKSKQTSETRIAFIIVRTAAGMISALIFAFWFMEDVTGDRISESKFIFISALIGSSTSFVTTASKSFERTITTIIESINNRK